MSDNATHPPLYTFTILVQSITVIVTDWKFSQQETVDLYKVFTENRAAASSFPTSTGLARAWHQQAAKDRGIQPEAAMTFYDDGVSCLMSLSGPLAQHDESH